MNNSSNTPSQDRDKQDLNNEIGPSGSLNSNAPLVQSPNDPIELMNDVQSFRNVYKKAMGHKSIVLNSSSSVDIPPRFSRSEDWAHVQKGSIFPLDEQNDELTKMEIENLEDMDIGNVEDSNMDIDNVEDTNMDMEIVEDNSMDIEMAENTNMDIENFEDNKMDIDNIDDTIMDNIFTLNIIELVDDNKMDIEMGEVNSLIIEKFEDADIEMETFEDTAMEIENDKDTNMDIDHFWDTNMEMVEYANVEEEIVEPDPEASRRFPPRLFSPSFFVIYFHNLWTKMVHWMFDILGAYIIQ